MLVSAWLRGRAAWPMLLAALVVAAVVALDSRSHGQLVLVHLLYAALAVGRDIIPRPVTVAPLMDAPARALNGAKRTNEALAQCRDGEAMLDVLLDASAKLGLGLTRQQLADTPPIRDWVWWKNKEALLTIGDDKPRYQQDGGQGRSGEEDAQPRRKLFGLF